MQYPDLLKICEGHLHTLCVEIGERPVGSPGNRRAADYFAHTVGKYGWVVERQTFAALHWKAGAAKLQIGNERFTVMPSPYSLGCTADAPLKAISSLSELEAAELGGMIVLLHGEIASEQLMPKNFVFYNPEEHKRIISLLEVGAPKALICATGRNAALAGGVYPFPLIEDGDFDIPSVYMTETEGARLLKHVGERAVLRSDCRRIMGEGCNVLACRGESAGGRVVVSAHIDAKLGTPGAIDNATGVTLLLLLAELLRCWRSGLQIELCALNGEDYYAASGQMLYLERNADRFGEIRLNINIDGLGYCEGGTAISFYGLPEAMENQVRLLIAPLEGIELGEPWVQGDHSMFVQMGVPAIAFTSQWFSEQIDGQEITHTPKDNLGIVDPGRVVQAAQAVARIITQLGEENWK